MDLTRARILIVDDEEALCEIFVQWLEDAGCGDVRTASDGLEALTMLQKESFDLLVTDVRMPNLDGVGLIRQLVATGEAIPGIVFVSGFGDIDEREMYSFGIEAFLSKPLQRTDLLTVVQKALADRSELWLDPFETLPRQSVVIEAEGTTVIQEEGAIRLGRGGFTGPYSGPVSLGRTNFELNLPSQKAKITGH